MALDERYITSSDIEHYFVDKDSGLPLAGGTVTFYRDIAPNKEKDVFQLSGSPPNYTYTPLPNPIPLSSVGTVQNAGGDNEVIYYYPWIVSDLTGELVLDLYYIVVRDSNGVEQFTRQAWPNITQDADPLDEGVPIQNQIANPQFTRVLINLDQPTVYTAVASDNEVFAFAPDWDFVLSGDGTVTVERVAIAGSEHVSTSPPYVLDIDVSSGITACYLRQRMNVNSGLWSSTSTKDVFISALMIARNENSGSSGVQMFYEESSGGTPVTILDSSFDNSSYQTLHGASTFKIPLSNNTDTGNDGYIDIYISFLASSNVRVSSIQVVPTLTNAGADLMNYDEQSSNREQALMGDYFIPRLEAKQIKSLLVGWDFQVAPFQFGPSGSIGATAAYIVDQTIAIRGATNVTWTSNALSFGLQMTTAGTNNSFMLLQYLTSFQVKKILGTRLSVNVFGYKGTAGSTVTMRVYLLRSTAAAIVPALPAVIGTIDTAGEFTVTQAGWTEIPRSGLDTATATLNTLSTSDVINSADNDYGFSGWEIVDPAQISNTDKFAIVVTFGYVSTATVITVNSISLVPGDIPCRPATLSVSETLEECQYYYETTYTPGVAAGTAGQAGARTVEQGADYSAGSARGYATAFGDQFATIKRANPTLVLYSPDSGGANTLTMNVYTNAAVRQTLAVATTPWTIAATVRGYFAVANTAADVVAGATVTTTRPFSDIFYHFSADARLGIV